MKVGLVIWCLVAVTCGRLAHGAEYKFEKLSVKGREVSLSTPMIIPRGYGVDYSLRADSTDAVIHITCTSLIFGGGNTCENSSLIISDGTNEVKLCRHQVEQTLDFQSEVGAKVTMKLRAEPGARVYCKAKAEPNPLDKFLVFRSEEVDSREHGLVPGFKHTSCPCGSSNKARIVGGSETKPNEYPFIVGMVNVDTMFLFCGATIISKKHAITAAHCTIKRTDKNKLGIVMGFHDIVEASVRRSKHGQVATISKIIEHENYDIDSVKHDIALLVLTNYIEYTTNIQPVCLPSQRIPLVDKFIKVLGWGKMYTNGPMSDVLRQVSLKVLPLEVCANKFPKVSTVDASQVCTFGHGKDSCQGDSGGPLVWLDPETNRYTLVALVSFGSTECASTEIAGINTEVAYYLPWIQKHIAGILGASPVTVQKCCMKGKALLNNNCHLVNETSHKELNFEYDFRFKPKTDGYQLKIGTPRCSHFQEWPIYDNGIHDKLLLLPDGTLRHCIISEGEQTFHDDLCELTIFFDYKVGSYCVEKTIEGDKETGNSSLFAMVCVPDIKYSWLESEYVIWQIFNCVLHIVAIICYLTVSVIHFVLPQLRDLSGNIITSIALCKVVGQSAGLTRIVSDYFDHINLFIADVAMFVSLLGAYFWVSALGFYLWKMFSSRNIFLRVTDGRKYCYYSYCVWSVTLGMTVMALFSHFILDTPVAYTPATGRKKPIGWLGMALFFCPIGFSVLVDIYFYVTTMRIINHMTLYGRIHHKLKYCFDTYIKIFLIMSISWMFFLMSWLPYNGMYYMYVLSNGLEAPLILCVSVLSERKVTFLLKKACCYEKCISRCCRPEPTPDYPEWGEEMMSINL